MGALCYLLLSGYRVTDTSSWSMQSLYEAEHHMVGASAIPVRAL
jgi:hypothetical protein